jgi:glycosyltransferase involved in cell wall biosynthesis
VKEQQLNIVSFDVPFPPNYGGAVDVFYKIKALHKLGVKIHLHCFEYGRGKQKELNKYCESVTYYQRDKSKAKLLSKLPFVVATRKNEKLLKNLNKNEYPILIEGLHNCWFLDELKPSKRFVAVRTHNVEHDYYKGLAKVEKSLFKKQFFLSEAKKLKAFESVLKKADLLLSISLNDTNYFNSKYKNAKYLPAFHSGEEVTSKMGIGKFALYHGNLGVGENNEASLYLIDVFSKLDYPLVLAGSDPSKELIKKGSQSKNVSLSGNISFTEMENLIADAHINILPTFQPTGIKLKLISALYKGRFCVVNKYMVQNTGLEEACYEANTPAKFRKLVIELMGQEFKLADLELRKKVLLDKFNNLGNAEKLVDLVF